MGAKRPKRLVIYIVAFICESNVEKTRIKYTPLVLAFQNVV